MRPQSRFIVFDGSDGSGKQTQVALLADFLRDKGRDVLTLDFPRYKDNFHGRILKAALQGQFGNFLEVDPYVASFLYTADRFESAGEIERHLAGGGIVVADRFTTANMIHQGGKFADPVDRDRYLYWMCELEFKHLMFPKPNAVVFLKVPVEISLKLLEDKKGKDQAEESIPYLEKSLACGEVLAKKFDWTVVDCSSGGEMRTREDIHQEIVERLGY